MKPSNPRRLAESGNPEQPRLVQLSLNLPDPPQPPPQEEHSEEWLAGWLAGYQAGCRAAIPQVKSGLDEKAVRYE